MPIGRQTVYRGRNVTVEFELNRQGIARCARGPQLAAACHDVVVTKAKPYALLISPQDSGEYKASFEIRAGLAAIGNQFPMLRRVCQLVNTASYAAVLEHGNEGEDGKRILARTLRYLERTSGR